MSAPSLSPPTSPEGRDTLERVQLALALERDRWQAELDDLRGSIAFGTDARVWNALDAMNARLAALACSVARIDKALHDSQHSMKVHTPYAPGGNAP